MVLRLPDSCSNWNLKMLVFEERGKREYLGKNLDQLSIEKNRNIFYSILGFVHFVNPNM